MHYLAPFTYSNNRSIDMFFYNLGYRLPGRSSILGSAIQVMLAGSSGLATY
jgi:hypothetical protein